MRAICLMSWLLLLPALPVVGSETNPDAAQGSDRDFVMAAAQAGQQEVHDAGVAAEQSRMDGVRQLAAMLLKDHRDSNAQLLALAQAKGLTLPALAPSPSPTPSFSDPEFVAAQIQHHEEAIALFKSEAARGTDREFRRFAAETLPALRRHLKALRALQTP